METKRDTERIREYGARRKIFIYARNIYLAAVLPEVFAFAGKVKTYLALGHTGKEHGRIGFDRVCYTPR